MDLPTYLISKYNINNKTMNKKMNNAKESVTISFPFEIYNNGEFLDNAILERTFDENELKGH